MSTTCPRAFTLIEILCVVVILGMVSAIIIPQLGSRGDLKSAAAARIVMADLMYAQNRAITKQSVVYVMFDRSAKRYRVQEGTGRLTIRHPVSQHMFSVAWGDHADSGFEDVSIDLADFDGTEYIAFDDTGAPYSFDSSTGLSPLVSGQIRLVSLGNSVTLNIEPYTGTITTTIP